MDGYTIKSRVCIYTEEGVIMIDGDIEGIVSTNPVLQIVFSGDDMKIHTRNFNNWDVIYNKGVNKFFLVDPEGREEKVNALNNMYTTVVHATSFRHMYDLMMGTALNILKERKNSNV